MILNDLPSIVVNLRLLAGGIALSFSVVAMLRLISIYREHHFSQSVYLLVFVFCEFMDALLRTLALVVFPTSTVIVTLNTAMFLAAQWADAFGIMIYALYLSGVINGFWHNKPKEPL